MLKIAVNMVMAVVFIIGTNLMALAAPIPYVPSIGLLMPKNQETIFSSESITLEKGVVISKGDLLKSPITLQINGIPNEFNYYIRVKFGKKADSWWERFNAGSADVLVKSEDYKSIDEGDEIVFHYKSGYWPFYKKP